MNFDESGQRSDDDESVNVNESGRDGGNVDFAEIEVEVVVVGLK